MSRPLIGVPTQTREPIPGFLTTPCWIMGQRYVRALTAAGGVPFIIPLLTGDTDTLRAIYERLDGVFLCGGVDIDPSQYGEERHRSCDKPDPDRDWTELTLIRWALADNKPVFGVCRGIQAINVAAGGSLYQHVPEQYPRGIKHDCFPPGPPYTRDYLAHEVEVEPGTLLGRVMGAPRVLVNSMHHQGIKKLAPNFRASVRAPDGLIEGIEQIGPGFLVGVQWHPEELADKLAPMRCLFDEFIRVSGQHEAR
jgi:putative glutamine amidotransferase